MNGELKLQELDRKETRWHFFKLFVLLCIAVMNIIILARLQNSINQNQRGTIEARKLNQAYIKCIILLRYDNPTLTAQSPRADVEAALDRCATNTANK